MALVARIKSVEHEVTRDLGDGTTETIDLSLSGRFVVEAEYFDDQDPTDILETQSFELPASTSVDDAEQMVVSYGQRVRDTRIRVNELRQHVNAVLPLS